MERIYYEINETQARQAKQMWSFSDYIDGSETESYRKSVDEAYLLCENVQDDRKEKALYYADMYAKKLAENKNKGFRIELMCPSIMISGASNFPVRKKEKQNDARHRNMQDYNYIQGYLDKIEGLKYIENIIKSSDENAIELLQEKVDKLESFQNEMKAANTYYRKHKTMKGFENLSDEAAEKMDNDISKGLEQCPYPSYYLTSNNTKIKATKQRLECLTKVKSEPVTEKQYKYFKVVRNTELMRLQIIFDGKPDEKTRQALKENGYKWSPNNGAWQRQLTNNALYSLKYIEQACMGESDTGEE